MVNWLDCIFIVVVIFSSIFFLNGSCDTSINLPLSDPASCYGPFKDQFSSVTQSCLSLCNPMDCCMPVHHQLPELPKLMSFESVLPSNHLILSKIKPG